MFRFESLDIWKLAVLFVSDIFRVVKQLPKEAQWDLGSQLRRAVLSISNNIAEGSGSSSSVEFKSFLNYSVRSTYEAVSMLFIMRDNQYIDSNLFSKLYDQAELLVKKIRTFRNHL